MPSLPLPTMPIPMLSMAGQMVNTPSPHILLPPGGYPRMMTVPVPSVSSISGIRSSNGEGRGSRSCGRGGGGSAQGRTTGRGRGVNGRGRSTGRGRGRSSGRGSESSTMDPLSCLPEALSAFSQGWEEITIDVAYEIVMKEIYNAYENNKHMCGIYENMADWVVRVGNRKGLPLNTFSISPHLLSDVALLTTIENKLVINGCSPTTMLELNIFIGTRWLRSRLHTSPELAFYKTKETAEFRSFILMDVSRYKKIYSCIRGFPLEGRNDDSNKEATWMRRGAMLRELAPLEKVISLRVLTRSCIDTTLTL